MLKIQTLFIALLVGGVLLSGAAVSAQGTGRWTTGAPMPSERSEVAVAEVGGMIYVVGGFSGQRELDRHRPRRAARAQKDDALAFWVNARVFAD